MTDPVLIPLITIRKPYTPSELVAAITSDHITQMLGDIPKRLAALEAAAYVPPDARAAFRKAFRKAFPMIPVLPTPEPSLHGGDDNADPLYLQSRLVAMQLRVDSLTESVSGAAVKIAACAKERDAALARVAELTKERDTVNATRLALAGANDEAVRMDRNELIAERDKALADLAAERELLSRAVSDLSAINIALGSPEHINLDGAAREMVRDLSAARAEIAALTILLRAARQYLTTGKMFRADDNEAMVCERIDAVLRAAGVEIA